MDGWWYPSIPVKSVAPCVFLIGKSPKPRMRTSSPEESVFQVAPPLVDMYMVASVGVSPEAIKRLGLLGSTAKMPKPLLLGRVSWVHEPAGFVPVNLYILSL